MEDEGIVVRSRDGSEGTLLTNRECCYRLRVRMSVFDKKAD